MTQIEIKIESLILNHLADIYTPDFIHGVIVSKLDKTEYPVVFFYILVADKIIRKYVCDILLQEEYDKEDVCINGIVNTIGFANLPNDNLFCFCQLNRKYIIEGNCGKYQDMMDIFEIYNKRWMAEYYDCQNKKIQQKLSTILKDYLCNNIYHDKKYKNLIPVEQLKNKYQNEKKMLEEKRRIKEEEERLKEEERKKKKRIQEEEERLKEEERKKKWNIKIWGRPYVD